MISKGLRKSSTRPYVKSEGNRKAMGSRWSSRLSLLHERLAHGRSRMLMIKEGVRMPKAILRDGWIIRGMAYGKVVAGRMSFYSFHKFFLLQLFPTYFT